MELPPGESFTLEYVQGKPWTGYNWYQGNYQSLIQINTDVPVFIDRALDVACHEGYPGHHVYNMMLEHALVRGRGWPEYQVYPLFSPQSLIAEGTANYGIDIAFPGAERLAFEREVLFPLAGLDPAQVERYAAVQEVVRDLSYAGNEAAREYLEGRMDGKAAAEWLVRYALMSPEQAAQRVRFFDRYRSYVINYNFGRDLIGGYIDRETGAGASHEARWKMFSSLLASPRLPQDLFPSDRAVRAAQAQTAGQSCIKDFRAMIRFAVRLSAFALFTPLRRYAFTPSPRRHPGTSTPRAPPRRFSNSRRRKAPGSASTSRPTGG